MATKKRGQPHSPRSKARSTPAKDARDDKILELLPGGAEKLIGIRDSNVEHLLRLAKQLVEDARKSLGKDSSKPRVARIEKIFEKYAGKPRKRIPGYLDKELRREEHVGQIAGLDRTWDTSYATALNEFDRTSVQSGSKIQDADDNWKLAVRLFESDARSAGAVFLAEVKKAKSKTPAPHADNDSDAHVEVAYHARGADISEALVAYESAMSEATQNLSNALGALIRDLFEAVTSTCVGEATLIKTTQDASKTFWSGVHDAMTAKS